MENYRDTRKSERQARPIQDIIIGLQALKVGELHDHMHWEDGRLVEDVPPRQVRLGHIVGQIIQNMSFKPHPPTPETAIDTVLYRARNMEEAGELPEFVTAWDVYNHFLEYHEGE